MIRNASYTEARFVSEQRRLMIRQHLTDAIGGVTVVPKTYLDAYNSYFNEQRGIEYVVLGPAQAGDIPQPTAAEIASYFESRKALFRAPEYRRLVLLRLAPEDVTKSIQVSDEDAKKYYETNTARDTSRLDAGRSSRSSSRPPTRRRPPRSASTPARRSRRSPRPAA